MAKKPQRQQPQRQQPQRQQPQRQQPQRQQPVKPDEVFPPQVDYDNINRGSLFQNNRKVEPEQPDMSGNVNIEGVEYWLSGWNKVSGKNGEQYVSLSAQQKDDRDAGNFYGRLTINVGKSKDNHPDMRGNLKVGNIDYALSGWFNESKNRMKFVSIAISDVADRFDESSAAMPWDF